MATPNTSIPANRSASPVSMNASSFAARPGVAIEDKAVIATGASIGASTGAAAGAVVNPAAARAATAAQAKADAAKAEQQKGKLAAIERAMGQIEKAYGKGAIMKLDGDSLTPIPSVPTGALSLDLALGGRGLPRGRVIEIFGPESSGKTTLALTVIANTQKLGGVAAFIDA